MKNKLYNFVIIGLLKTSVLVFATYFGQIIHCDEYSIINHNSVNKILFIYVTSEIVLIDAIYVFILETLIFLHFEHDLSHDQSQR